MTEEQKYLEVHKTFNSPGWAILKEMMEAEYLTASRKMNSPKSQADDHYHFMRGVLHSADQLMSMPVRLLQVLENNALMEKAKQDDKKT